MTHSILVVCDKSTHPRGRTDTDNVATFSGRPGESWSVVGDTGATRPSKPGKPRRVVYALGPAGYKGDLPLRCKRCGDKVPPIPLDILNSLARQRVSQRTIEELRVLASKQQ